MRLPTVVPPRPRTSNLASARRRHALAIQGFGGLLLIAPLAGPAQGQVLRGTLDAGGSGILGTGLTVSTTGPGNGVLGTGLTVGTTGGSILGTGAVVGTTNLGSGVLGTGLTVGTTSGGILGSGLRVGTTGPGDGLLGTGVTLGTASSGPNGGCVSCNGGGTGTGVYIVTGGVTQSQAQTFVADLRLSQIADVTAVSTNNVSAFAAPVASGGDALAVGYGAGASGVAATAVGTASAASGAGSSAYGFGAGASGTGATAIGTLASATGSNSVALGSGAAAGQANTVAIGSNVRTTQANQVAIGNAANTYTLAGLASPASAAAQSGATQFVTTDAGGNLAASSYGPSAIAGLGSRLDSTEARIGAVESRVTSLEGKTDAIQRYAVATRREARQGVAMAIAMATAPMPSAPGRTTWATNGATYRGEWAGGIAVAHRLPTCCVPIAITAGVAYGGSNSPGVRAGLAGEF